MIVTRRSYGRRNDAMRITTIALVCILAVVAVGIVTVRWYRLHEFKGTLANIVDTDASLAEAVLEIDSQSSKVTYGEFFDLCSDSIKRRTDLIMDIRRGPKTNEILIAALVQHLFAENDFVRTKSALFQRRLNYTSTFEAYVQSVREHLRAAEDFFLDPDIRAAPLDIALIPSRLVVKRKEELQDKAKVAAGEAVKSATEFLELYGRMESSEAAIATRIDALGVRFERPFQRYAHENRARAEEMILDARQVIAAPQDAAWKAMR